MNFYEFSLRKMGRLVTVLLIATWLAKDSKNTEQDPNEKINVR